MIYLLIVLSWVEPDERAMEAEGAQTRARPDDYGRQEDRSRLSASHLLKTCPEDCRDGGRRRVGQAARKGDTTDGICRQRD
jgi:hypothetical protein